MAPKVHVSQDNLKNRAGRSGSDMRLPGQGNANGDSGSPTGAAVQAQMEKMLPADEVLQIARDKAKESTVEASELQKSIEQVYRVREAHRLKAKTTLPELVLDASGLLADGADALIDDSFWRCFEHNHADSWNWNVYLFPLWCCGVILRYFVLFPLRLLGLLTCFTGFLVSFFTVHVLVRNKKLRRRLQSGLIRFQCNVFIASWTGVVRYHGPAPVNRPGHVWVANHTSMIDWIVLTAYRPFSVIMQLHKGWVGFIQTEVVSALNALYFSRTDSKDRALVSRRMKEHVHDPENDTPLLVFPEGTCVNNEYCVRFARGAFVLDSKVCPIAIKYNKIFVDAFWNSRRQSFTNHLYALMTSWAVVCDVYFLEPQSQRAGETDIEFAQRVQRMIAKKAGLQIVPWDGMLKYVKPNPKIVDNRRAAFAERLDGMHASG
ncbi:unnamed protein product [Pedinophyceae sp. YPF-701]|nr:unnamed protein product [Pedinophyceae sp. YPF-701]